MIPIALMISAESEHPEIQEKTVIKVEEGAVGSGLIEAAYMVCRTDVAS